MEEDGLMQGNASSQITRGPDSALSGLREKKTHMGPGKGSAMGSRPATAATTFLQCNDCLLTYLQRGTHSLLAPEKRPGPPARQEAAPSGNSAPAE